MNSKKYKKSKVKLIIIIYICLITLIPFIPYNSSGIKKNNILYDEITINSSDPPNLKILGGTEKFNEFCLENKLNNNLENGFYYIKVLTGNNPISKLTTYGKGIPKSYVFKLYGKFEDIKGAATFNVTKWRNISESKIYFFNTTYIKYYKVVALIGLLLIIYYIKRQALRYKKAS